VEDGSISTDKGHSDRWIQIPESLLNNNLPSPEEEDNAVDALKYASKLQKRNSFERQPNHGGSPFDSSVCNNHIHARTALTFR
jgi:hypothetical protein